MADVKLTKNELRDQQMQLVQLEKYLPTLQLKKAMLQSVIQETRIEIHRLEDLMGKKQDAVNVFSSLLAIKTTIDPMQAIQLKTVFKRYENIAGVEIPYFEGIEFEAFTYSLFETSPWIDAAVLGLRSLVELREQIKITTEQKQALEHELREVSIRVNLFEKILIPRAIENIRIIKVFLGDQQLAAVSRAKVAKTKIEANKKAFLLTLSKKDFKHA
ncbi:V-type ATP synthase subunit D [Candidatus Protochlamydia amoebophila]|uniref:V-type ATP synthase subunit D n=1 Tax=Candidatus Protochlamydia amoebophila TaxID=362787 RepID=UPI001BC9DAD3|nr:V-type ATP synthase subunit D [Candidatus Protochlamydia amoebophila]